MNCNMQASVPRLDGKTSHPMGRFVGRKILVYYLGLIFNFGHHGYYYIVLIKVIANILEQDNTEVRWSKKRAFRQPYRLYTSHQQPNYLYHSIWR